MKTKLKDRYEKCRNCGSLVMESIAEKLENENLPFRSNKKRTEYVVDSTDSIVYNFVKESVDEYGDTLMVSTKTQGGKTYIRLLYQ